MLVKWASTIVLVELFHGLHSNDGNEMLPSFKKVKLVLFTDRIRKMGKILFPQVLTGGTPWPLVLSKGGGVLSQVLPKEGGLGEEWGCTPDRTRGTSFCSPWPGQEVFIFKTAPPHEYLTNFSFMRRKSLLKMH